MHAVFCFSVSYSCVDNILMLCVKYSIQHKGGGLQLTAYYSWEIVLNIIILLDPDIFIDSQSVSDRL
jgi:hypothetical protein